MQYPKNKRRNRLEINTESLHIICNTYNTRNGFAHECSIYGGGYVWEYKVNYLNRTWESFTYETLLKHAADKIAKIKKDALYADEIRAYIDARNVKEREECEAFLQSFEKLHNALTPKQKESLSNVTITSESEARAVMGVMACMNLMNGVRESE